METFQHSRTSSDKFSEDFLEPELGSGPNLLARGLRMLQRRSLPAIAAAGIVFVGVLLYNLTRTPEYEAYTVLLLNTQTGSNSAASLLGSLGVGSAIGFGEGASDVNTEIQVVQSRALVKQAIAQLSNRFPKLSVDQVMSNLTVRQITGANAISILYVDTDPAQAQAVLDALGSTYLKYNLEAKRTEASRGIAYIEAKLPEAQQELNNTTSALRVFRERNGFSDPDLYSEAITEAQQELQGQAASAQVSLNQSQRRYQELRRQLQQSGQNPDQTLSTAVLSQDPGYIALVTQLQTVEVNLAQENSRLLPGHPLIQELKENRARILALIRNRAEGVLRETTAEIDLRNVPSLGELQQDLTGQLLASQAEVATSEAALISIGQAQRRLQAQFEQLPKLQQTYLDLQRQVALKSAVVENLWTTLQTLRVTEAQETSSWQVLEPPELPTSPSSPNFARSLLISLILAGLFGIGTALLLEGLDNRLTGVEEIRAFTPLPILAQIPRLTSQQLALLEAGDVELLGQADLFSLLEALRGLALNLLDSKRGDPLKTLVFTSTTYAEGKSTLTYLLALVMAELGRRVLVVDADMRKPTLHQLAQQPNSVGLSTAIATEESWRDLIHTGATERLDILVSGPNLGRSITLLESPRMKELLREWRQIYDYVLIDTTPIGISDAQSLLNKADGVVLLAGLGQSTRSSLNRALEILAGKHCQGLGLVVNFLNEPKEQGYYYLSHTLEEDVLPPAKGKGSARTRMGWAPRFLNFFRR